jgi:molybdopterin molybdotransferase
MERLGRVLFHGIAVKPGKPTLMANCQGKYIIGLPGHPLSCAVVYRFIVKKLIDSMYGRKREEKYTEGIMAQNYHKAKGREEYLPVALNHGIATPIYVKSSAISVLARCSGFVKIERDAEGIMEGQRIRVLL